MADFHPPLLSKCSSATPSNGNGGLSLFGGPHELAAPPFSAPKIDYSKIFRRFHSLKTSSSIPFLHLPVVEETDAVVGAPSSILDYSEVFSGFDEDGFAISYEELVEEKPSANAWSPVEVGSKLPATEYDFGVASEECDGNLFASSEKRALLSNRTSHDISSEISKSNNIGNESTNVDSVDETINVAQFHNLAGITSLSNACYPSSNIKDDKSRSYVTDNHSSNVNYDGGIVEGEHLKETALHSPVYNSSDLKADQEQFHCTSSPSEDLPASDQHHFHHVGGEAKSVGCGNYFKDMFLSVSDINLQTGPSQVPPPLRPPPKLVTSQTDSNTMMADNMRAYPDEVPLCKLLITDQYFHSEIAFDTNSHEEASKGTFPPFFDIEIDASSAAVSSAGSLPKERSRMRLSVEEATDEEREDFQDCAEVGGTDNRKTEQKGDGKIGEENENFINVIPLEAWEGEKNAVRDFPEDERQKTMRADFEEKDELPELRTDSGEKWKWNDLNTTFVSHKLDERAGKWEAIQLYELVKRASIDSPENAPEREITRKKMKATVKVHEFELNEKAAGYVQQEKSGKSIRHEEHDEKVKVAKNAHKGVHTGDELKEAQVALEREEKMETNETCEREEEKKPKAVVVVHQHEEIDNEVEVAEKACDQEFFLKEVKPAHNTSGCGEKKRTLRPAKDASEHTKTEKTLTPADIVYKEYKNRKLKTVGEVSVCENNGRKLKELCDAHAPEEKIEIDEEAREWEAIGRKLKVPCFASEQGQMESLKVAAGTHGLGRTRKGIRESQVVLDWEENKNKFIEAKDVFSWLENTMKFEAAQLGNVQEEKGSILRMAPWAKSETNQQTEGKEKNANGAHGILEMENQERMWKEREQESESVRKIGQKESAWGKEKNDVTFTKESGNACDDAFAETQERTIGVLLERVTAEYQQRVTAVPQERTGKESIDVHENTLTERSSVEVTSGEECSGTIEECTAADRDTSGSWDCAAGQPLTENIDSAARERTDNYVTVRCTIRRDDQMEDNDMEGSVTVTANADNGFEQIISFPDVGDFGRDSQIRSTDSSCSSIQRCSYSKNASCSNEKFNGADDESARRCQARLERHQQAIERAAKALAEKKFRDILVQREQAERNRLAETLDADVRRWSNGKEGNLRALLSTLQYILGPESGWRLIPLADVITADGVKKAYRKAALCVHPDKVQQRGASIRQKYVCEKVYDLLKEAWNKFNSEG
ncbi:hypothetical protein MRB53_030957 [Persea americana]|uniref:Uncharacterized protein n=1 Tax=Persea americana TaxID=3435 RepID=A0ACC2KMZ3_PERAE|nr:hypothetical protein MRB53_030957 [Persea americana]